jgi:tyrosyl-tRNA synthetase
MTVITDPKKIDRVLERCVIEAVDRESLRAKLLSGRQLRIKFGADPSSADLHLGHAVCLRKLREFQELGHQVVFIVGDYTARIGDPSGKSKTRPQLTGEQVDANAKTYFEQAGKVLDVAKMEIHFNGEWFAKMSFADILALAAKFTVARMIERDDFDKRLKEGTDVHLHEIMYPMMQAYDSVAIKADVEIGGSDQRFNILAGRELQKKMGMAQQDCLFIGPLMLGTDGVHKMSKSLNNYVGLTDLPSEMFGKVMSVPDAMMWDWFMLATDVTGTEIAEMKLACERGEMNPRDAKMRLAREIIGLYHSAIEAEGAQSGFIAMFQKKEVPEEMPDVAVAEGETLMAVLVKAGLAASNGEARRTIEQGGVKLGGEVVVEFGHRPDVPAEGLVLQKGKRHFVRLVKA